VEGGGGNDSYTFSRGDGADTVVDHYTWMVLDSTGAPVPPGSAGGSTHEVHSNGGADTLAFGPGIGIADVSVRGNGADVIVAVKDPAHAGVPFGQPGTATSRRQRRSANRTRHARAWNWTGSGCRVVRQSIQLFLAVAHTARNATGRGFS
jgi:hypothetical protein